MKKTFRFLALNCDNIKDIFDDEVILSEYSKEDIELLLLKKVNAFNKKLNISKVIYESLQEQFPFYKKTGRSGAIIEDTQIDTTLINEYKQNGYYVFQQDEITYARNIIEYVFFTPTRENSRNIFISQTLFPALVDYMEDYLNTSNYTCANHKFMLINIANKEITADSIITTISILIKIGLDYLVLFDYPTIHRDTIPDNIKTFIKERYANCTEIYENKYYKIDFTRKLLKIKTYELETKIKNNIFEGSDEKFYWIQIFPIAIFAHNSGYKVDYSEYDNFCQSYRKVFSSKNKKFNRCITILRYLEKYFN